MEYYHLFDILLFLKLCCINSYWPPKYCANFFDYLSELLSIVCIDSDCAIIVDDFKIYADIPAGQQHQITVLYSGLLTQHVT